MLRDSDRKILQAFVKKERQIGDNYSETSSKVAERHHNLAEAVERALGQWEENSCDCYRCGRHDIALKGICSDCSTEFDERSDEFQHSETIIENLKAELHETNDSLASCHDRMEDAESKIKAIQCLLDGRAKAQTVILEAAGF